MIDDVDEALRQLLKRDLPIKNNEVRIAFDLPNQEWSARLNRPTLNLYLHDIRENVKLRQRQYEWEVERDSDGSVVQRRKPVRVDLHYLITAWAKEPEDEHRLLARTLMVLFRYQDLPEELLPESLQAQPAPIALQIAQYDNLDKPSDIWNVLDNQQRPGIVSVLTLALNPYEPTTSPIVRTRELIFGQRDETLPFDRRQLVEAAGTSTYWTIGGTVKSDLPLDKVRVTLLEKGLDVEIQEEGRFAIGNLRAGDYTLEFAGDGREARRHPITVPSPDYEFEI